MYLYVGSGIDRIDLSHIGVIGDLLVGMRLEVLHIECPKFWALPMMQAAKMADPIRWKSPYFCRIPLNSLAFVQL